MVARTWFAATAVAASAVLLVLLFVPLVATPEGSFNVCGPSPSYCGKVVQYESLSYELGGTGALFQTGTNWYSFQSWMCSCPAETPGQSVPCCVPPLANVIWPAVGSLVLLDIVSLALLVETGRRGQKTRSVRHKEPEPALAVWT